MNSSYLPRQTRHRALNCLVQRALSGPDQTDGRPNERTTPAERDPRLTCVSLLAHVLRLPAVCKATGSAAGQAETHSSRKRIPGMAGAVSQRLIVYLNIPLKDSFPLSIAQKNKLRGRRGGGGIAERNSMMNGAESLRQRDLAEDPVL